MSEWKLIQRRFPAESPEFRSELSELARSGMRIVALAGIVLPALLIVVPIVVLQLPIAVIGVPGQSTAIWDELSIVILAGILLWFSFSERAVRNARLLFAVFVWIAGAVMFLDDMVHPGSALSTNYLALLILVAVGAMPYRRLQMFGVAFGLLVVYLALAFFTKTSLDLDSIVFLIVLGILGGWLAGLLYDSRKRQSESLQESSASEERYHSLFRDASDAIFTIENASGCFSEVNPALERMLGVAVSELQKTRFLEIVHPDDRPMVLAHHERRIRGEAAPSQYQFRIIAPATGEVHVCDVTIHRGSGSGLTAGIARDLTERMRAEQTIREYAAALERSNREIVATQARLLQAEKNAAMADLIAGVVHELNTPLAVVQCNVDLTSRAASKIAGDSRTQDRAIERCYEAIRESCGAARSAADRISSIVKTLKSFAYLDQAEVQFIDVNRAITDTLELLKYRLQERIVVKTQLLTLPELRCQARNINQMIAIIIRRAIEAIEDAGTVSLSTRCEFGVISIVIRDSGAVLSAEQQAHLFDPCLTVRENRVGLGLELPIAHQVALAHGGSIEVESIDEVGTTITIALPLGNET